MSSSIIIFDIDMGSSVNRFILFWVLRLFNVLMSSLAQYISFDVTTLINIEKYISNRYPYAFLNIFPAFLVFYYVYSQIKQLHDHKGLEIIKKLWIYVGTLIIIQFFMLYFNTQYSYTMKLIQLMLVDLVNILSVLYIYTIQTTYKNIHVVILISVLCIVTDAFIATITQGNNFNFNSYLSLQFILLLYVTYLWIIVSMRFISQSSKDNDIDNVNLSQEINLDKNKDYSV